MNDTYDAVTDTTDKDDDYKYCICASREMSIYPASRC
jgi:hypothetical protein